MSLKLHTRQLVGSLLLLLLLFLSTGRVAHQGDGERFSALIKSVRVNGVELHYLEKGSGIPVVLIHGGSASHEDFIAAKRRLDRKREKILVETRWTDNPFGGPET